MSGIRPVKYKVFLFSDPTNFLADEITDPNLLFKFACPVTQFVAWRRTHLTHLRIQSWPLILEECLKLAYAIIRDLVLVSLSCISVKKVIKKGIRLTLPYHNALGKLINIVAETLFPANDSPCFRASVGKLGNTVAETLFPANDSPCFRASVGKLGNIFVRNVASQTLFVVVLREICVSRAGKNGRGARS